MNETQYKTLVAFNFYKFWKEKKGGKKDKKSFVFKIVLSLKFIVSCFAIQSSQATFLSNSSAEHGLCQKRWKSHDFFNCTARKHEL